MHCAGSILDAVRVDARLRRHLLDALPVARRDFAAAYFLITEVAVASLSGDPKKGARCWPCQPVSRKDTAMTAHDVAALAELRFLRGTMPPTSTVRLILPLVPLHKKTTRPTNASDV